MGEAPGMTSRRNALAAALLLAATSAARAGCCLADPSALDLDPAATPLLLTHDRPAGELALSWESIRSSSRAWQGDLDLLWAENALNDEPVEELAGAELRLPVPAGNAYFLATASCDGLSCSRGRDSAGAERGDPACAILERGELYPDAAACLGVSQGVIRDVPEYEAFAACFSGGTEPAPPAAGEALVWKTDHASSACGTCLEFACADLAGDDLVARPRGLPWGDCDAIHHGGAWARVPDVARIVILEEMPPTPDYGPCY